MTMTQPADSGCQTDPRCALPMGHYGSHSTGAHGPDVAVVEARRDASTLRAAAAIVEVRSQTAPHLVSLANRLLALAATMPAPDRPDDDQEEPC